ncbi:hypothetical protein [Trichloromonas sp.]
MRSCRQSVNQDYAAAGLGITDVSPYDRLRIEMVMKYYSFPHDY